MGIRPGSPASTLTGTSRLNIGLKDRDPGVAPCPTMTSPCTLVDLFESSCDRHRSRPAFGTRVGDVFQWQSYAEVQAGCARWRALLQHLGVAAKDRVAIIADNRVEWALACYATLGLGAVFVPMYTAQTPADWRYVLRDSGASLCIVTDLLQREQLEAQRVDIPAVRGFLILDAPPDHPESVLNHLDQVPPRSVPTRAVGSADTAGFLYTSGTTGRPKGVVLSHGNLTSNAVAGASCFEIGSQDRSLSFLPWAHALGQTGDLHTLFWLGVAIAINDTPASLLSNLLRCRPTLLIAVPRIFNRIYDGVNEQMGSRPAPLRTLFEKGITLATRRARGESLSATHRMLLALADTLIFSRIRARLGGQLRLAVCGSAALAKEVAEFINALGIEIYEGYGLTEASPIVALNSPRGRRFGTVGLPLPGVTVSIDRTVTGDSSVGEIVVAGPNVMQGYHGSPQESAEVLLADGRLRTGDLGCLDEQGFLIVTGRLKEQYKLENGKYVAPGPLEERLRLSPYIQQCMIYGLDRPYNVAILVLDRSRLCQYAQEQGFELGEPETNPRITALLNDEVARLGGEFRSFERPRRFLILSEDFTTHNGLLTPSLKIRRREVVERYKDRLDDLYAHPHDTT